MTEVGLKLYPRIWRAELPRRVKLEMFFRLTGNISYPLMILTSLLQSPLLLVRYNQGFYNLMIFDLPLLFFSTARAFEKARPIPSAITSGRCRRRRLRVCGASRYQMAEP